MKLFQRRPKVPAASWHEGRGEVCTAECRSQAQIERTRAWVASQTALLH